MTRPLLALSALTTSGATSLRAQHLHRLPARPEAVAYGYYSAAAKPVRRIASGDTVEVETLITSTPPRLEAAGVAPAEVQQSLRDIVEKVTDKGPGGHILTGPIYVEGADSGGRPGRSPGSRSPTGASRRAGTAPRRSQR